MYARAANTYRKVHIESASPVRVLDELFFRLLADIDEAERLIAAGDAAGKGNAINHAIAILYTLTAALDTKAAPELCADLSRLYAFARGRLLDANRHFRAEPLAEARRAIKPLHEAFSNLTSRGR